MSSSTKEDHAIQDIPLDNLLLDPRNPRLPNSIEDEPSIAEWLVKNADVVELMESIGSQGYQAFSKTLANQLLLQKPKQISFLMIFHVLTIKPEMRFLDILVIVM